LSSSFHLCKLIDYLPFALRPSLLTSSFVACERKIVEQCEEGARIGCAVSATRNCKPTWWKALAGLTLHDLKEREECEVGERTDCFAVAKEKCAGFAREKCLVSFRNARIRVAKGVLSSKGVGKLIEDSIKVHQQIPIYGEIEKRHIHDPLLPQDSYTFKFCLWKMIDWIMKIVHLSGCPILCRILKDVKFFTIGWCQPQL
ncbi:hypothetical protein V8G54_027433, partial [Vigna mungo]